MSMKMVTDLDDLLGRCRVATEKKLVRLDSYDAALDVLRLPFPRAITSAQVASLKPLYLNFMQEMRRDGLDSAYLAPLRSTSRTEPDAAAVLLYFCEFPFLVRSTRGDEAGQFIDIVEQMAVSPVATWCRKAISEHANHHSVVLGSCINILMSVLGKKNIQKFVLCNSTNPHTAFDQLSTELAASVSREEAPMDAIANAIQLQFRALKCLQGDNDDRTCQILKESPHQSTFLAALERHRDALESQNLYQHFRLLVGASATVQQMIAVRDRCMNPTGQANPEVAVCDRDGCDKAGTMRCISCKLVSYCSKECQTVDWKAGHKQICKLSRKTNNPNEKENTEQKIAAATEAARQQWKRPALLYQDERLALNPNVDYIIIMPTGGTDEGIRFSNDIAKTYFRLSRSKAPTSAHAVNSMYTQLSGLCPDLKDIIRLQLQKEYGVDPLSD